MLSARGALLPKRRTSDVRRSARRSDAANLFALTGLPSPDAGAWSRFRVKPLNSGNDCDRSTTTSRRPVRRQDCKLAVDGRLGGPGANLRIVAANDGGRRVELKCDRAISRTVPWFQGELSAHQNGKAPWRLQAPAQCSGVASISIGSVCCPTSVSCCGTACRYGSVRGPSISLQRWRRGLANWLPRTI